MGRRVVITGLGLGYLLWLVSHRPQVLKITVVERDPHVIAQMIGAGSAVFPDGGAFEVPHDDECVFLAGCAPYTTEEATLADYELQVVERVSYQTVRRVLKKRLEAVAG